jgi:hypothetical protein
MHNAQTTARKPDSIAQTLSVDPSIIRTLDALRKQRNLSDYDGEHITDSLLNECLAQALALIALSDKKWPK